MLVLAGVAIFALRRRRAHRAIAHGGSRAHAPNGGGDEMIEQLEDHYIICGYGRVGRRVGAGVPRRRACRIVVLDFNAEAIRGRARARRSRSSRAAARTTRTARGRIDRARGLVAASRLRRGQPLHHALGAGRAPRPADRRAGVDRGRRRQAPARRRRPRRPAVRDGRAWRWRSSSLKPQVAAFLDIVSPHGGPDLRSRRSR